MVRAEPIGMIVQPPEQVAAVEQLYRSHRNLPYISPERDLAAWLEEVGVSSSKAVRSGRLSRSPTSNFMAGTYLR